MGTTPKKKGFPPQTGVNAGPQEHFHTPKKDVELTTRFRLAGTEFRIPFTISNWGPYPPLIQGATCIQTHPTLEKYIFLTL